MDIVLENMILQAQEEAILTAMRRPLFEAQIEDLNALEICHRTENHFDNASFNALCEELDQVLTQLTALRKCRANG
jgi:hypothetical protein